MGQVFADRVKALSRTLSRIDGIEVFCEGDEPFNEKLSVYFTYKEHTASIEEQVKFIDWFARLLGDSSDYAAYSAIVSMVWMGDKGMRGNNKPFFVVDTYVLEVESLTKVINAWLDDGVTVPSAIATNHPPKSRNIPTARCKIAEIIMSFFENIITLSVFMSWVTALAKAKRFFKECISYMFAGAFYSHKHNISKPMGTVNQNR